MAGAPETGRLLMVLPCRRVKLPRIVPSGALKRTSRPGRGRGRGARPRRPPETV